MSRYCEYCGSRLPEGEDTCPSCGAPVLPSVGSPDMPQTIEELKAFCSRHNLPLADMRFFIGQDYPEPRAFGIYEDEYGQFVVYKNKADGSRAIRYRGGNEAYAVREIYLKMKEEIKNQRRMKGQSSSTRSADANQAGLKKELNLLKAFFALVIIVALVLNLKSCIDRSPKKGYYHYGNDYYYSQGSDWYVYDTDASYWVPTIVDEELGENYDQYYESPYYSSDYGTENFADTPYYDYDYDDDDWDDDSDWDWDSDDSWDSDLTDWDSDW